VLAFDRLKRDQVMDAMKRRFLKRRSLESR